MNKISRFAGLLCLTLLVALALPNIARADDWDHATKMTFNEPVEVPGRVLPAGTYWFTLMDSSSDRNIVQIWDADRMHLITTILAIPDLRLKTTDKTVLNFDERPLGSPETIHEWFYPGSECGQEFVYPKTRAVQLAQQVKTPVLSLPDEHPVAKEAPVKAVTPAGEEISITEVVVAQAAPQPDLQALPKTGSPLPLLALIGTLAIVGAGLLRRVLPTNA